MVQPIDSFGENPMRNGHPPRSVDRSPGQFSRLGPILVATSLGLMTAAAGQSLPTDSAPPGQLVDIGGYRLHLWCTGERSRGQPTVVLSAGGGDFATDWSLVQRPLADSTRVCSYDRPGYGWSDPGPYPRTFHQEAFEVYSALKKAGEAAPYVVVGHSIGGFVVRAFADSFRSDAAAMVLVDPTNENGMMGYRGRWILPRTMATNRPLPPVHKFLDAPPKHMQGAEADSCKARAIRSARIWRPYDQLRAQAQKFRVWALEHPACVFGQDDYFAEELAGFFNRWATDPHPLGDLPLTVIRGAQRGPPPPGLTPADLRSDSMRIDLSKLSQRGKLVVDTLSGHHVQLDNPNLVVSAIREILIQLRR